MRQRRRSQSKTGSAANEKAKDEEESSTSENSRVMHVAISAKRGCCESFKRWVRIFDDPRILEQVSDIQQLHFSILLA